MPGWSGTLTAVYDQAQYGLTKLRQLWRVMYLGNGYYSIRPMHKLDMAMTLSGGNVAANPTTTMDTENGLNVLDIFDPSPVSVGSSYSRSYSWIMQWTEFGA